MLLGTGGRAQQPRGDERWLPQRGREGEREGEHASPVGGRWRGIFLNLASRRRFFGKCVPTGLHGGRSRRRGWYNDIVAGNAGSMSMRLRLTARAACLIGRATGERPCSVAPVGPASGETGQLRSRTCSARSGSAICNLDATAKPQSQYSVVRPTDCTRLAHCLGRPQVLCARVAVACHPSRAESLTWSAPKAHCTNVVWENG